MAAVRTITPSLRIMGLAGAMCIAGCQRTTAPRPGPTGAPVATATTANPTPTTPLAPPPGAATGHETQPDGAPRALSPSTPPWQDLEALCAALHTDYGDGTLSDYFKGLALRDSWSRAVARRAEASITPGRVLERALAATAPTDVPPACQRLLADLDDLE